LNAAYRGRQQGSDVYNWFDPWHGTVAPRDISGHGTHTLGVVVGQTVGVAPGAMWIGCVNLARNLGNPALYLDCLQFMLAPFPHGGDPLRDGRPELGAHVLNNSWGCPPIEGCDAQALLYAVRALRDAGLFVVASAGNEGANCGSVSDPIAIYDAVFSVGAVDGSGQVAPFSSRGPVLVDGSGRIKPDLVAPGVEILSAAPGGGYSLGSGTSDAGPHVTGVVALMWSANPALIGDIERTEQILAETARPYDETVNDPLPCNNGSSPNNTVGYGLLDAFAAVEMAINQ
jgi:subtilisin family serine protease